MGMVALGGGNAQALTLEEGAEAARCDGCPDNLFGNDGVIKNITNTVLYVVGIIAVIMLIVGGIRYVLSGGDAKKVTDAKNTILYAIIGLIIAILSFAIVNFVINALPSGNSKEETNTSQNAGQSAPGSQNTQNQNNAQNSGSGQAQTDNSGAVIIDSNK